MKIDINKFEYKNAKYEKNGTITCEWNHPQFGWIPFGATPYDCEEHGRQIFEYLKANADIKPYVEPPPPSQDVIEEQMRSLRNSLIFDTDWTQHFDVPEETKVLWKDYRQQLRDVPQQSGFPYEIVWPTAPADNENIQQYISAMLEDYEYLNYAMMYQKQNENT